MLKRILLSGSVVVLLFAFFFALPTDEVVLAEKVVNGGVGEEIWSLPSTALVIADNISLSAEETAVSSNSFLNDPPQLALNEGLTVTTSMSDTIDNSMLLVTDIDTPATGITYTLLSTPMSGTLSLGGAPLLLGNSFAQSDIDGGLLTYQHNGNLAISDSFSFEVGDRPPSPLLDLVSDITGQANGSSYVPSISGDGRYVAFSSGANNMVAGDTNGADDIFLRDTQMETIIRVSVDSVGGEANGGSFNPSISADGRYIAFQSSATNLVVGDTNGIFDTFVHDTQTGATTRVSLDSVGAEGNGHATNPSISADGRYVAFHSSATNLVAGDTNGRYDIFVHDTQTGATTRVSVDSGEFESDGDSLNPSISADGRYLSFDSEATNLVVGDSNGRDDIFVRDTQAGTTIRVSVDSVGVEGDGHSDNPSISGDGRYVSFNSRATNLVAGDTNGQRDVFLHDTQISTTIRISVDSVGTQANSASQDPSISGDGRFVAFKSFANNLVVGDTNSSYDIFVHDTQISTTIRVSVDSVGVEGNLGSDKAAISADGRHVAFDSASDNLMSLDTNFQNDVFVHDTQTGVTIGMPVQSMADAANGASFSSSISGDGRYVAFSSSADNLIMGDTNGWSDIFVRDTQTGLTTRVSVDSVGSESDDNSFYPSISADGRYVAFQSSATNLVAGDFNFQDDIFVHDTQTGVTIRVSVDSIGTETDGDSYNPSISGDGRYIAFQSWATNLVAGDFNFQDDIFVHDTQTGVTSRVSVDSLGTEANSASYYPAISDDGRYVAFQSFADNLVAGDFNFQEDVFVHDTLISTTIRVSVDSFGIESDGISANASISADGRYVAFSSSATNLVAGDGNFQDDIFVHDTLISTTIRVSVDSLGAEGNSASLNSTISGDGRYVAFESYATNLVSGDSNGWLDIFLHDTQTGETSRLSINESEVESDNESYNPSISADGNYITFESPATNLVMGDTNGNYDIFVYDNDVRPIEDIFDITILQPPIATDDVYTTAEEISLSGNLVLDDTGAGFDSDGGDGGTLSVYTYTMPATGTLMLNLDGSFIYTPALNYNGVLTFSYQISDTLFSSNQAMVTITVTPVNDTPIGVGDYYTTTMDTPIVVFDPGFVMPSEKLDYQALFGDEVGRRMENGPVPLIAFNGVLANDNMVDVDGDSLVAIDFMTNTLNGFVSLHSDGTFFYAPDLGYTGIDIFTYIVSDGILTDTGVVTITINDPNNVPVAVSDVYTTAEDIPLIITATNNVLLNDTDADLDPLTSWKASDTGNGAVVLDTDGEFIYVANPNYFGPDSFTYYVNDGQANSITTTVWLTVTPVNDPPIAFADVYTTEEATLFAAPVISGLLANDSEPVENDPFTAVLVTPPVTGSLVLTDDGSFEFTPPLGFTGIITFEYVANDGDDSELTLVTINVTPGFCVTPPDAIDIGIVDASVDANFSWAPFADSYEIYRSATPYFTVGGAPYDVAPSNSYSETGILGAPTEVWFYQVIGVNGCGTNSGGSNETAVFEFDMVPGS